MNYDAIRHELFARSYVASELVEHLSDKYGIPTEMSYSQWREMLLDRHGDLLKRRWQELLQKEDIGPALLFRGALHYLMLEDIGKEVTPEITAIARELGIDEDFLRSLVLYDTVPEWFYPRQRIFDANNMRPITEDGTYIKIDDKMTERELLKIFRYAKLELVLVHKIKPNVPGKIKLEERKRKDIGEKDKLKRSIYCAIEGKIIELAIRKKEIMKASNRDGYDYSGELVGVAMEQLVGDALSRAAIEDYESFSKLESACTTTIKTYYYEITARYRLPTPQKLSSILGLVNS